MKSREDLLRGAVGKLRPESSLRDKVLSGANGSSRGRPAVRRFSLVGAACLAVLAVAILLPSLLTVSVEPVTGPGAQANDTPSLSVEQGDEVEASLTQSVLIGIANDGMYLDAVAVVTADPLGERVACMFLSSSCVVNTESAGAVAVGELYRLGGAELFETEVETMLDISVDGAVVFSYDALASYINAEGGASVYLLEDEAAYLNGCNLDLRGVETNYTAGSYHLDGQEAVWFLRFSADGENQLTSRSGRRVALAESLWEGSDADRTPAGIQELLAGALESTLSEPVEEKSIASLLSYRFDCTAFPDDTMHTDGAYDGEGWEMMLDDLPSLRAKVKDFLLSDEMKDRLSSVYLPPYESAERTEIQRAVDEAFLDMTGMRSESSVEVAVPAVWLYSATPVSDSRQVSCVTFGLCVRFRLDGTALCEEEKAFLGARLLLEENEDGTYELQAVEEYLDPSLSEFPDEEMYLSLAQGDEQIAAHMYHWVVDLGGAPYWNDLDRAIQEYRSFYGLDDTLLSYEMEGLPVLLTEESPLEGVLDSSEYDQIFVETGDGFAFYPERGEELLAILRDQDWGFEGRFSSLSETGLRITLLDADGSAAHWLLFSTDGALIVDFVYRYEIPQSLYDSDFSRILSEEWQISSGVESAAG